jgi:hypothetical protein
MSKNTVRIIADGGSGTSYYLSGGASSLYSGSGTPWTAESTSPYQLSLTDTTGASWTPSTSPGQMQFIGGPPFQTGSRPLYTGYGNVVETFGVAIAADSKDNAQTLVRQLHQVLNTALYTLPPLLAVQGGTNTNYFEIYQADITVAPTYIYEPEGRWRCTVTWTRSATSGRQTTAQTVVSAITMNNRGTTAPTNSTSFSTGSGDLINQGSPLNIVCTGNNSAGNTYGGSAKTFLATILSNTYVVSGATLTSSTTTGANLGSRSTFDLSPLNTNRGVRLRICANANLPGTTSIQARCYFGTGSSGTNVYTSAWTSSQGSGGVTSFYDLGYIPNDVIRRVKGLTAPNLYTDFYVKGTGGSNSYTLTDTQFVLYYDWCNLVLDTWQGNEVIQVDSFPEQTNAALLPYAPKAWHQLSSTAPKSAGYIRGTAPRYFAGAKLFYAFNRTDGTYSGTDNWTFTATHAPQYLTLRASG